MAVRTNKENPKDKVSTPPPPPPQEPKERKENSQPRKSSIQREVEEILREEAAKQIDSAIMNNMKSPYGCGRCAGDEVYYLNSDGFQKGRIVSIIYTDSLNQFTKDKVIVDNRKQELIIRVRTSKQDVGYRGDEIPNELLFSTYEDMIEYYKKNPIE